MAKMEHHQLITSTIHLPFLRHVCCGSIFPGGVAKAFGATEETQCAASVSRHSSGSRHLHGRLEKVGQVAF